MKLPDLPVGAAPISDAAADTTVGDIYKAFAEKHKARIDMWMKDHPESRKFPIIWQEGIGLIWVNRADRRKMKKQLKVVKK